MKSFLMFLVVFLIFAALCFVAIQLDLLMNPWLRHVIQEWRWYNYFTSRHSFTVLYLKGWLWLIPSLSISVIASLAITYRN